MILVKTVLSRIQFFQWENLHQALKQLRKETGDLKEKERKASQMVTNLDSLS